MNTLRTNPCSLSRFQKQNNVHNDDQYGILGVQLQTSFLLNVFSGKEQEEIAYSELLAKTVF